MWSVIKTFDRIKGYELSAVPNLWLSKNGKIVHWPVGKAKNIQEDLVRDATSKPKSSWVQLLCRVKRYNIATYEEADLLVDSMSGGSSSECGVDQLKKRPPKILKGTFQHMMQPDIPEEVSSQLLQSPPSTSSIIAITSPSTPTTSLIHGSPLQSVPLEQSMFEPATEFIDCYRPFSSLTNDGDSSSTKTNRELEKINLQLASQQTTLNLILDRLGMDQSEVKNVSKSKFQKIENKAMLREFNIKLEDEEYKSSLVSYLFSFQL